MKSEIVQLLHSDSFKYQVSSLVVLHLGVCSASRFLVPHQLNGSRFSTSCTSISSMDHLFILKLYSRMGTVTLWN
ncbi:hypothetical protein AgCh_029082 [Apium graveolens]